MTSHDIEYYRARLAAEQELALAAETEATAAIHETLAREYQRRIDGFDVRPTLKIVSPN